MSRDTESLRMPEHDVPVDGDDLVHAGRPCRGGRVSGYAHMNPDGTLHCNRCGWVTPEPVITAYSPDTGKTYLTWDDLVLAEANGYVVVGTCSRPGTVPVVVGPWDPTPEGKAEARKAQARLRRKWRREEQWHHGDGHTISTFVRVLWR